MERRNRRVAARLAEERPHLSALPQDCLDAGTEVDLRVPRTAMLHLGKKYTTVPSRLIGHRVRVRMTAFGYAVYLGTKRVCELPWAEPGQRFRVNLRHVLSSLRAKPGAFRRWVARDDLFPRAVYRRVWEALSARRPEREADRTMVGILSLAVERNCVDALARSLEARLDEGELPDLAALEEEFRPRSASLPAISVAAPNVAGLDELLGAAP